jgi:hypothetical protein
METEVKQVHEQKEDTGHHKHTNTIFVEVSGKDRKVDFDRSTVTGAEIRSKAGVPSTDDLTRLDHGKPVGGNIAPTDRIEIKDGEHFLAAPTGVVS